MTPFGQIKVVHFSNSAATLPFSHLVTVEKPILPLAFFPFRGFKYGPRIFLRMPRLGE